MLDYTIITKTRVYENEPEEIYAEQCEKMSVLGLDENKYYLCHFFDSVFRDEITDTETIYNAIQCLAIKDGVDMVQFSNGNLGFVAYYNSHKNGFEIIG